MYVCMSMWAYIHTYILSFSLSRWRSRSFSRSCRAPSPLAPSSPSPKRDLLQCQKRPITVSKETYYRVKRDLLQCQKRPITVSKETYYNVKRNPKPYSSPLMWYYTPVQTPGETSHAAGSWRDLLLNPEHPNPWAKLETLITEAEIS